MLLVAIGLVVGVVAVLLVEDLTRRPKWTPECYAPFNGRRNEHAG